MTLFIADLADSSAPVSTTCRCRAVISSAHPAAGSARPASEVRVGAATSGIRRTLGVPARQADPRATADPRLLLTALPDTLATAGEAPERAIRAQTGHRRVTIPHRHVRRDPLFDENVPSGLGGPGYHLLDGSQPLTIITP